MKYTLLFFSLFICLSGYAQQVVKGIVLDKDDSTEISLAHIYLKNQDNYGTISNEKGAFVFYPPTDKSDDTLVISAISYKSIMLPLSQLSNQDTLTFLLEIDIISLNEFVISPYSSEDSVKVIVQRAFDRLKDNYANRLHYMSGFFREVSITEGKYSRLMEAAINIQDKGIQTNVENGVRIQVEELRKSDDMKAYHLGLLKMNELLSKQFKKSNILLNLYERNKIRIKKGYEDFSENYLLDFLKIENYNGDKVIVISYQSNFGKYEQVMSEKGFFYINLNDFAIVKVISKHSALGKENGMITVQFKKVNGRYYPVYIEENGKDFSKPGIQQYNIATMMMNEIITDRKKIDRIKKRFAESGEDDLYKKDMPYHPEFWKNYNILLLAPITEKLRTDLEGQKKLDIQFKTNSKN